MSGNLESNLKNGMIVSGGVRVVAGNAPTQYKDNQYPYYADETKRFIDKMAKYSSDFVEAQIQGLNQNDPFAWGTYRIRLAEVVRPSSAIQRNFDDYKQILFESEEIDYIKQGTKIVTNGSTWLATNPINLSGVGGNSVIRRCNAVWNHLDYYGNVVSEPIIVENTRANANDSDAQNSQLITKGYFNVICQYNDATRQIDTNTRLILGTGAYRVTGYSDFETEFTGDYNSVRVLNFTIRYEEPNTVIDDMENHVADGKSFSWNVSVSGQSGLTVGTTATLTASSVRNGETVTSTTENPITYVWESSDESVVTVDSDGNIEAIAEGFATIRVKVSQNIDLHTNFTITVTASTDGVDFTTTVPEKLAAYESTTITAAYFENGEETAQTITWKFSGANELAYSATISGNSATITCFGYSDTPLVIEAIYDEFSASTQVELEGV